MKKYILQTRPSVSATRFEKELNPQQLEAACAPGGQVLIVAGAGSGKTRTLIYRLLYLLESGVPPSAMALCTFTRKAARQMLERAARHEPELARQVWGGTFHHLANRILRQHCQRLGYSPDYTILDSTDAGELLGECLTTVESGLQGRGILPRPHVLQALIGLSVATMTPLEKVVLQRNKRLAGQLELLLKVARLYEQRKRQMNLMDFDDLLWRLRELLQPDSPVAEEIAARFKHVLVDEYQDTNPLQAHIVDRLASVHGNLTVVGDDAQSIYGFRGASTESMLTFKERWPEAIVYRLELNYRSTPPILDAANLCISNNKQQLEKTLRPVRSGDQKPIEVVLQDPAQEAQFVAQRVAELHADGVALDQIAVLYRAHSHSMELQVELTKRQIPYLVRSGVRFFEQAHIKDVLAYLRVLHNPHDGLSWQRLLRLQPGIGRRSALAVAEELSKDEAPLKKLSDGVFENLRGQQAKAMGKFRKRFLPLVSSAGKGPGELVEMVLESGYRDILPLVYQNFAERQDDIEHLAQYAGRYDTLADFLAELHLLEAVGAETLMPDGDREESLVLSTVHQAKGLEWRVVFVLGLCEGWFPHSLSLSEKGGLEEERRLFYVAITRARDELYLCSPLASDKGNRLIVMRSSRFLDEIRPACERWVVEHA